MHVCGRVGEGGGTYCGVNDLMRGSRVDVVWPCCLLTSYTPSVIPYSDFCAPGVCLHAWQWEAYMCGYRRVARVLYRGYMRGYWRVTRMVIGGLHVW